MVAGPATLDRPLIGGRYRLVRLIHASPERSVYEALDTVAGLTVSVALTPDMGRTSALSFAQEAHRAARLSHPNIAALRDWGRHENELFLVSEWHDGRRLAELLDAGLDPGSARAIASTVQHALKHAHTHEVSHGLLRPEQIVVRDDGEVVIDGFGLWPAVQGDAAPDDDIARLRAITSQMASAAPPTMPFRLPELVEQPHTEPFQIPQEWLDEAHRSDDLPLPPPERTQAPSGPAAQQTPTPTPRPATPDDPTPAPLLVPEIPGTHPDGPSVGAALLRVGLLVVVVAAAIAYLVAPKRIEVPAVVGLTEAEAVQAAQEAGIGLGEPRRVHDQLQAGTVVGSQPPQGSQLRRGTNLVLVVSKGPELFAVPQLTGASVGDAQAALERAGFLTGSTTLAYHDEVPEGVVIEQSGAGESLPAATPIDLVVSRGPEFVAVPSVVGRTLAAARDTLSGAGLEAGRVSEAFDARTRKGLVVSQKPGAGKARRGARVDLVVSKGPEMVSVPQLSGIGRTEARKRVEAAGMVYAEKTEESETTGKGISLRSDPPAGRSVEKGSRVTVVFSDGPATFAMPSLVGLTRAAAAEKARSLGLVVAAEKEVPGSDRPAGEVVGQTPRAGSTVRKGAKVEIFYSA